MKKVSHFGKYELSKEQYLSAKYYALRYDEWMAKGKHKKVNIILDAARDADADISEYIIKACTHDIPYWKMEMDGIPCGQDKFYNARRKFYFILAHKI